MHPGCTLNQAGWLSLWRSQLFYAHNSGLFSTVFRLNIFRTFTLYRAVIVFSLGIQYFKIILRELKKVKIIWSLFSISTDSFLVPSLSDFFHSLLLFYFKVNSKIQLSCQLSRSRAVKDVPIMWLFSWLTNKTPNISGNERLIYCLLHSDIMHHLIFFHLPPLFNRLLPRFSSGK